MKIIYIGGYDPKSTKPNHFYELAPVVKELINNGKQVVFVTFAQPAKYFDPRILEIYGKLPDIIDTASDKNINWGSYDLIYIPGGNKDALITSLKEYGFDMSKLKNDVTIIADSAGAYAVSKYYFTKTATDSGGITYKLSEGLNPSSSLLTVTHANNVEKVTPLMLEEAKKICDETNSKLLVLNEYEMKMLIDNETIVPYSLGSLLN